MLSKLKKPIANAKSGTDPLEFEQAVIRLIVGIVVLAYILFIHFTRGLTANEYVAFEIVFGFEAVSTLHFFTIINNKFSPPIRRLSGSWIDIGAASLFLALTGSLGVMLVAIYLWVIFGNGFRFGKKYLYHSQILSIIGFIAATTYSSYWQNNTNISESLILMLVALPLYVAKLITRINEARQNAEAATKRAEEANTAKTRFVANMSHEIRTPLNGIIGISTLFKSTPLNADQKDLLKSLESSSKLLLSLLNNVLDFTKIEERKLQIEKMPFSAEEVVYDTIGIFRTQAQSKNIQLGASASQAISILQGDGTVLRQVLANLVGNAIKFTEQGSVTVSATLLAESEDASSIRFEVTDTGVGIPADKQHKVFESFTQADASTTRKFGGSGLGLTIAKDMVEAMGGALKFQSTESVGTRFWFDLTLDKNRSHVASTESSEVIENDLDLTIAEMAPLNILVCEDEETNQKIITRLLSLPGHQVSVVDNSEDMLDKLEDDGAFDIVITDLNMAGMSGIEALKLYRFTRPEDKLTKFILFTADVTLETKEEANVAGFDGVLTKPIEAKALFTTIQNVLDLPKQTATYWLDNLTQHSQATNDDASKLVVKAESNSKESNTVLDTTALIELEKIAAGDDLFMHRLLKNYLADSLKIINKITTAAHSRHYGELKDYCHALKGNSLSVGALALAESTQKLASLTIADAKKSQALLQDLNHNFAELTLAVEDYLRKPEAVSN